MAISDLSRLRARWDRLEGQLHKLENQLMEADLEETLVIEKKISALRDRIHLTKGNIHREEIRLMNPDAKLHFTSRRQRNQGGML